MDKEFLWADQHTEAFTKAKELVSKAPCLRYFDVNAPVVLQVDASEYGLGAALLQPVKSPNRTTTVNWQPVAFSSSSLTATDSAMRRLRKKHLPLSTPSASSINCYLANRRSLSTVITNHWKLFSSAPWPLHRTAYKA